MTQLPNIIAIETATSACSVALCCADKIFSRSEIGNNIHSKVLLEMVNSVLCEAGIDAKSIDAVAVGQGPGSFTGLRIGIGVAQGLAYGAACPMIGISSLDALAMQSTSGGTVLAGIDARMGEVYWARYLKGGVELSRQGEVCVSPPTEIQSEIRCTLVGNAWGEYKNQLNSDLLEKANHLKQIIYPNATALLELSIPKYKAKSWVSALGFVPEYVRNNVAKKSVNKM